MQEHCVVLTLLPGRGESARDFMRQLADGRRAEQERAERRVGIAGERWFLGPAESGELLIGLIESEDLVRSLGLLSVSMEPHDLWFKRRLADITGVELNETPALPIADAQVPTAPTEGGTPRRAPGPLAAAMAPGKT